MYTKQVFQYSPLSELNTLEVYLRDIANGNSSGLWIVYIHGGAWRDTAIDASSVEASVYGLFEAAPQIAGIASLNYRLSRDLNSTNPAHNASHPDHIEDVLTALGWLEHKYGFGERYILVGHSAGATLAFQAVSCRWKAPSLAAEYPVTTFVAPIAITGLAGIYDLKALVKSFASIPFYRSFVEAAFGEDEAVWDDASPAHLDLSAWSNGKCVVLADSDEDELIDAIQLEKMFSHLADSHQNRLMDSRLKLKGDHDSIWREGSEQIRAILYTLNLLPRSTLYRQSKFYGSSKNIEIQPTR